MQIICTLLQTDNHASTSPLSFHGPDALPAAQPTASKHWRYYADLVIDLVKLVTVISYLFSHFMVEWCQKWNLLNCGKHSCIIYVASWLVRFKVPRETGRMLMCYVQVWAKALVMRTVQRLCRCLRDSSRHATVHCCRQPWISVEQDRNGRCLFSV